ncbi:hypothetical protein DYB36_005520 [Aphanomyces astaci]|uniref:C2 domain-containing protein n=1 Tax=Aphanomyces astaci TaxID=112090 RepID=A0A397A9M6_APHAT|nr:hypothetical protein DYB36_005520 [Aphanomyces astaci]
MPCTIKIRLVEARGLPVVERASKVADAYVDITFASFEARSTVSKKSLTPRWDEEFRFDVVDDAVLQSQPIMFKVMDHDVYTTDATIGIVYVDLNCILMKEGCSVQGWYPIYDTLLGVRGELHLVIRLHYFGDINPFRESSAGVQFFSLSTLDPAIFTTQRMLGFVEELVVHADPEYSWSDSFRTSRKSNEYRQLLLYKLSSQVSTMVRNVLYLSSAPHPHVSGMVARACGTAVFLVPTTDTSAVAAPIDGDVDALMSGLLKRSVGTDDAATLPSPSVDAAAGSADQGSGSPRLATMPSLRKFTSTFKPQRTTKTFELGAHDEIQLLTVKAFHPDTRVRLGGIVTARSVKFLGKMATKLADQETRDSWWLELREERPEVRQVSLDTLFASLYLHGPKLSPGLWNIVFKGVLIPLISDLRQLETAASVDVGPVKCCRVALCQVVGIFGQFYDAIGFLPELLFCLGACMTTESNSGLACAAATTLENLLVSHGLKFPENVWGLIADEVRHVVSQIQPTWLLSGAPTSSTSDDVAPSEELLSPMAQFRSANFDPPGPPSVISMYPSVMQCLQFDLNAVPRNHLTATTDGIRPTSGYPSTTHLLVLLTLQSLLGNVLTARLKSPLALSPGKINPQALLFNR